MRVTANPIPNVRLDHPLYQMDRLAAGMDTDREEQQWPNVGLLILSVMGLLGYLGIVLAGGGVVYLACVLALSL